MLATLYCDASFCPHSLVGGWAIWLRSDRGRIIDSGLTPGYCKIALDAEMAAIYAGLYRAVTRWPETEAILIRSDCQAALHYLKFEPKPHSRRSTKRLAKLIHSLKREHKVRLIPRWVKGHRRGENTDVYLNNRVDEMARAKMEKQR